MNKFTGFNLKKSNQVEVNEVSDMFVSYTTRNLQSKQLMVALDEPIVEPKYYRPLVDELLSLHEGDTVVFRINSPGGRLDGLVSLLNAMEQTDAEVLTIIDGECHSAASLFTLHSPNIMVSPYATMMVHNGTYGVFGKESDIINMVQHQKTFSETLIRSTYEGFLSVDEIDNVLNGREYWFLAEEIERRLEQRSAYFDSKLEAEEEAVLEVEPEVIPVAKAKKAKPSQDSKIILQ